ncbi:MAG: hypothetical protein CMD68_00020 [Gammaproteobacteria bacterium]|nr:hypothetical protein [Gammaproteobacteria bacterium]
MIRDAFKVPSRMSYGETKESVIRVTAARTAIISTNMELIASDQLWTFIAALKCFRKHKLAMTFMVTITMMSFASLVKVRGAGTKCKNCK